MRFLAASYRKQREIWIDVPGIHRHIGLNSAAQIRRQSTAAFPANPIVEHAVKLLRQRNAVKAKNPIF